MDERYRDMLYMTHPEPKTRPRMSVADRAAQFSPFAALTGYDDVIRETARTTHSEIQLDEDKMSVLNEKLRILAESAASRPEITVTYFVPDEWKAGGAYLTVTGKVKKVDPYEQILVLTDGTVISMKRIYEIEWERSRKEIPKINTDLG